MANRKGKSGKSDGFDFLRLQKKPLDSDCSHELKRSLLLRRKAITNLDRILKSRDITLPTKIMASGPITSWEQWKQWQALFSWSPQSLQILTAATKLKDASSLE